MAGKLDQATIDKLNARMDALTARLGWLTDTEARAAWVNGFGANGELDAQRTKLIGELEATLDALEAAGGGPVYHPK